MAAQGAASHQSKLASRDSQDVEALFGPLPLYEGSPRVSRPGESSRPPLPTHQPYQPPPLSAPAEQREAAPKPPAAAGAAAGAAAPKPPPRPQPTPQAKPAAQQQQQRQQQWGAGAQKRPAGAAGGTYSGSGAAAGSADGPPPAADVKFKPGQHVFTYAQLKGMRAEDGIDPARKEAYLSEAEFRQVFGMSRSAFEGEKRWRQLEAKKSRGLW